MNKSSTSLRPMARGFRSQAGFIEDAIELVRRSLSGSAAPMMYNDADIRELLSQFGTLLGFAREQTQLLRDIARFLLEVGEPSEALEELWCLHLARLTWDLQRARENTALALAAFPQTAVERALASIVEADRYRAVARRWRAADPSALAEVERAMRRYGKGSNWLQHGAVPDAQETLILMLARALQRRGDEIGLALQRSHRLDQIAEQAPDLAERLRAAVPIIDAYLALPVRAPAQAAPIRRAQVAVQRPTT